MVDEGVDVSDPAIPNPKKRGSRSENLKKHKSNSKVQNEDKSSTGHGKAKPRRKSKQSGAEARCGRSQSKLSQNKDKTATGVISFG